MRLIDADAAPLFLNTVACEQIKQMPTVDAVPVIRCKDCRHYDKSEDTPYCLRAMWWQDEGDDWFCAGAERREDER